MKRKLDFLRKVMTKRAVVKEKKGRSLKRKLVRRVFARITPRGASCSPSRKKKKRTFTKERKKEECFGLRLLALKPRHVARKERGDADQSIFLTSRGAGEFMKGSSGGELSVVGGSGKRPLKQDSEERAGTGKASCEGITAVTALRQKKKTINSERKSRRGGGGKKTTPFGNTSKGRSRKSGSPLSQARRRKTIGPEVFTVLMKKESGHGGGEGKKPAVPLRGRKP